MQFEQKMQNNEYACKKERKQKRILEYIEKMTILNVLA